MTAYSGQMRLGIIGCGAVSELYHLPAASGIRSLPITCLVDRNQERARLLARKFNVANVPASYTDCAGKIDAAVVATPNGSHKEITTWLLRHGIHVLCEKPLAVNVSEAQEMTKAQRESGCTLAVAFARRTYGNVQAAKAIIDEGVLGHIRRVKMSEGGGSAWPARTSARYDRPQSGGGYLIDTGSHLIDLLRFWFGGEVSVAEYFDDADGGVEASCEAKLFLQHEGPVEVTFHITAIEPSPICIVITGSCGSLVLKGNESIELLIGADQRASVNTFVPAVLRRSQAPVSGLECFRMQLEWFFESIQKKTTPLATATDGLEGQKTIEACYAKKQFRLRPWERCTVEKRHTAGLKNVLRSESKEGEFVQ